MKKMARIVMATCCWSIGLSHADTHYVDINSTTPSDPYTSWATAATDIRSAVDASESGDTVLVADGHYILSASIDPGVKDITIRSVNGFENTIVDGNQAVMCFYIISDSCVDGFTITNGYSYIPAGGIYCGGIGSVVSNCLLTGNECDDGPGGMLFGKLYNSIVRNNQAIGSGDSGGIGGVKAYNCLIINNSGHTGGGAEGSDLYNCTVVGNTATYQGGGAYNSDLYNSIVWYNTAAVAYDDFFSYYPAESSYSSCSPDVPHGLNGNITNAPLFIGAGDYRLAASSPCINTGSNGYVTAATDLDGFPRIVAGTVDMGAYESGFEGFLITGCTPNGTETILEWTAFPMTETKVQYSTDLLSMPFTDLSGSLPYPANTFTDTVNAAADQCFYRVKIEP